MTARLPAAPARRGSAYVLVLGVVAIATAAGVLGVQLRGMQVDAALTMSGQAEASDLARSALEIALARIEADSDWRETYDGSAVLPATVLGDATVLATIAPVSGHLRDGPATLTARARLPGSVQEASVVLDDVQLVMNSLSASLVAGNLLTVDRATVNATQPIRGQWTAGSFATINPPAEATTSNTGFTYVGGRTVGIAPQLPDPIIIETCSDKAKDVFKNSPKDKDGFLLGPSTNTIGNQQSNEGVYILDCEDTELELSNFRLLGTLILVNNTRGVTFSGAVRMDPTAPNMPVLLSDGRVTINIAGDLSEDDEKENFNPNKVPWQGVTDKDEDDTYPSAINGLVYVDGGVTILNDRTLGGPVIASDWLWVGPSTILGSSKVTITDNADLRDDPPAEFYLPAVMTLDPFSYRN